LDINEDKFEIAKTLGATAVFNSSDENVIDDVKACVTGGAEYVFETAGVVPAMQVAYAITKRGGSTVTTGLPDPKAEFSLDRKSTRLNSSHVSNSYAVFCLKKKKITYNEKTIEVLMKQNT